MSNQIIPSDGSDRVEKWLHIDDFSPGCYDGTYISTATPVVSAPIGAANATGTFCCASIPSGGLGPLPSRTTTFGYSTAFPGSLTTWFITGFIVNPGLNVNAPELIIILEGDDGTTHYVLAYSYVPATLGANIILNSTSTSVGIGIFGAPYPAWTRMGLASGTPPTVTDPPPVLVFPGAVSSDSHGNQGHLYIYPPILAPTTFAVQDLVDPGVSGGAGQVITYGSRVIVLTGHDSSWPTGGGINTNENIDYTDPPQSSTYGNQNTILSIEEPWGYGAWGSVSVGELLLVKKDGGGLIVNGDIDNPNSIISIPGLQPTGGFVGKAQSTTIGLIYCSQDRGAWVWNGGNTSQKISAQLRDDFYDASSFVIASNNYGFNVSRWQDWVLFSNNWLFNSDTGGWWRLFPGDGEGNANVAGQTFWWFSPGNLGNEMWVAPLRFTTSNRGWFSKFDSHVPAPHYQWTSLPIHVTPNAARVVDVTQVIVRVSSPDNTGGTATISIGGWSATTSGTIGANPTTFRFNAGSGSLGLSDISIQFTGDNTGGSSPILHSIDVGYTTRALQGADN